MSFELKLLLIEAIRSQGIVATLEAVSEAVEEAGEDAGKTAEDIMDTIDWLVADADVMNGSLYDTGCTYEDDRSKFSEDVELAGPPDYDPEAYRDWLEEDELSNEE